MSVIRWEDPPPDARGLPKEPKRAVGHELIAVQLRRRPGVWALIHEVRRSPALPTEINQGKHRPYQPPGSFESVSRQLDGVFRIYARYVGQESTAAAPYSTEGTDRG